MDVYEVPDDIDSLFNEVNENDGEMFYRIIDYGEGMSMDNNDSMRYFTDCIGIHSDFVEEDLGTQVTLFHPDYNKRVVINAGGLGDFFSHSFECSWHEDDVS